MKFKIYFLLSVLIIFLIPLNSTASSSSFKQSNIGVYELTNLQTTFSINVSFLSAQKYNLTIVKTNIYEEVLPILTGTFNRSLNPMIVKTTELFGTNYTKLSVDNNSYSMLYLVVYGTNGFKSDLIKIQSNVSIKLTNFKNYFYSESNFDSFHGNLLKIPQNTSAKKESAYRSYSITLKSGNNMSFYLKTFGANMTFVVTKDDNVFSADNFYLNLNKLNLTNVSSVIMTVPSNNNTLVINIQNPNQSDMKLKFYVFLNPDNQPNKEYRFVLYSNVLLDHDLREDWYNGWIIPLLKHNPAANAPWAGIFLVIVSIGSALLSYGVSAKFLDLDDLNKSQERVNKFNKLKKKAKDTADKKLWHKVQSEEKRIQSIQQKIMFKRMLPQFVLILPFIAIFTTLRVVMGDYTLNLIPDRGAVVAILPFDWTNLPFIGSWFSFYVLDSRLTAVGFGFWYFFSAIFGSVITQRVLGINIQGGMQPAQR